MILVVIKKERSCCRWERQDEIRNCSGGIPLLQQEEGGVRSGSIDALPVQLGIPFVTRAFDGESPLVLGRAPEDRCRGRVRVGRSANVGRQDVANARQGIAEKPHRPSGQPPRGSGKTPRDISPRGARLDHPFAVPLERPRCIDSAICEMFAFKELFWSDPKEGVTLASLNCSIP